MSLETLLTELADPAAEPASSELVHLSDLGPEQVATFLERWSEMALRKRRWLLDELVRLAEDNVELSFDAVFLAALDDRDPDVRREAIRGLWEYEGRDLIRALIALLENDPDAAVRAEAAIALGRFVLQAELDMLRASDAERIEQALHRAVDNESEMSEVRARALEALGARSEGWVRDLVQDAYDSGDRRLRLSAVHAMGRSADGAWLPSVYEELESDDAEMRFEAAGAAGAIADEGAASHVLPLLLDEDAEVQLAAIAALGQIGGPEARAALRELFAEKNERTHDAVEAALADLEFAEDPLGFTVRE
ncbi:MAG: HEAT repeat domain-containing protein [Dehalococcoidia bacterium]